MFCPAICGHKDSVVGQIGLVGREGLRRLLCRENWHLLHWDVTLARQLGTSTLGGISMGNSNGQAHNRDNGNWQSSSRWHGITRPYTPSDVDRLKGSLPIEHTVARHGAERLWSLLQDGSEAFVPALGAMTGNQAVQQVRAGLKAIYVSGWQVAADANNAGQMYPDQSLYPADSVPNVVRNINQALMRADQIHHAEGNNDADTNWFPPLIADAEAGFGGNLNAFELMK